MGEPALTVEDQEAIDTILKAFEDKLMEFMGRLDAQRLIGVFTSEGVPEKLFVAGEQAELRKRP